ncbi:MAG: DedA family protein [Betaproteobacteria bacterium]
MERHLIEWLSRYGPSVLFAAQMFGIFGVPIPDELLLTVAGALVRRQELQPVTTAAAAVGGCMTGITLSYVLGRTVGLAAIHRVARLHEASLQRGQRWFRRFGGWLLTFGYFVPGVRHVTAIAAGSTSLEYSRFAAYAYPGAVLWCATFLLLGYFAGDEWERIARVARHHLALVSLALVAAVVVYAIISQAGERSRSA